MKFQDVLTELYTNTKEITVYAANAFDYIDDEVKYSIGIRSFFCDYEDHDPIVDGTRFMVCGTIFNIGGKEVTRLRNLNDNCIIKLRANSIGFPTAVIDLGRYTIVSRSEVDERENITLHLKRM